MPVATATLQKYRSLTPGLILAGAVVACGFFINSTWSSISPLTASLVIGAVLGNAGFIPTLSEPGLKFASRNVLRAGIVVLGLQLSFSEVAQLGGKGFLAVVLVVSVTFFGTQAIAKFLGVSPGLGLLTATGYSICGVSAISAMTGAVDGDEEDATYAIALVTLFGSISIFFLPFLGHAVGMGDTRFGMWSGSAVHDVAQVVASATAFSQQSLGPAVIVKLTRVVLLAPLVSVYAYRHRRARANDGSLPTGPATSPLPLFIVLFLVAVCVRSTGVLSPRVLADFKNVERTLLAMALVGLGAGVRFSKLRLLGSRPVVLGVSAYLLVLVTSYFTIRLIPLTL